MRSAGAIFFIFICCLTSCVKTIEPSLLQQGRTQTIGNWNAFRADALHASDSTAVVFFSFERTCPLCRFYKPLLDSFSETFSSGALKFVALPTEIEHFLNSEFTSKKIEIIPYEKSKKWLKNLGFTVTPEVVVVDKRGLVIYRGKIDDRTYDTGKHRRLLNHEYLKDVLIDLQQGMMKPYAYTEPGGCYIEYDSE